MQIDLLTAATAVNGVPDGATAGVKMPHMTDVGILFAHSVAGTGTMNVTLRFWVYNKYSAMWAPFGTGTAAAKGILNAGAAIAEHSSLGTDVLLHAEPIRGLQRADRVYLEVLDIDTAVATAFLDLDATLTTNVDTIIENAVAGAIGNSTTIAFTADGTGAGTLDESAFPAIVFHFETGVTTVTDFETAIAASTHLAVRTGGTGGNVLLVVADDFTATALAGGVDGAAVTAVLDCVPAEGTTK